VVTDAAMTAVAKRAGTTKQTNPGRATVRRARRRIAKVTEPASGTTGNPGAESRRPHLQISRNPPGTLSRNPSRKVPRSRTMLPRPGDRPMCVRHRLLPAGKGQRLRPQKKTSPLRVHPNRERTARLGRTTAAPLPRDAQHVAAAAAGAAGRKRYPAATRIRMPRPSSPRPVPLRRNPDIDSRRTARSLRADRK